MTLDIPIHKIKMLLCDLEWPFLRMSSRPSPIAHCVALVHKPSLSSSQIIEALTTKTRWCQKLNFTGETKEVLMVQYWIFTFNATDWQRLKLNKALSSFWMLLALEHELILVKKCSFANFVAYLIFIVSSSVDINKYVFPSTLIFHVRF